MPSLYTELGGLAAPPPGPLCSLVVPWFPISAVTEGHQHWFLKYCYSSCLDKKMNLKKISSQQNKQTFPTVVIPARPYSVPLYFSFKRMHSLLLIDYVLRVLPILKGKTLQRFVR